MSEKSKNSKNSESNPQNEESQNKNDNDNNDEDQNNDNNDEDNNDQNNNDDEINDSQGNAENEEENEINSKDENNNDVEDNNNEEDEENNQDQQSFENEENENDHDNEEDNYENIEDDYHKDSKRSMNPSEKIDYTTVKPMYKGNKESVDNLDKSSLNHNIDEKNPIEEENNEEYNRQQQQSNDDAHTENEAVKADFENHQMNKDVSSSEEMINLSLNKPSNNGLAKVITNKEPKELTALEYDNLIEWLSELKFERPLNFNYIARDFSDGIKYVTILKIYFPKFVDNHNYIPTLNKKQKIINWETVSSKVLRKLGLELRKIQIERIVTMESGYIEKHLFNLKDRIQLYYKNREHAEADTFLNTTKSFFKGNNCTNFDDTVILENKLDNVWSDKEEQFRKEIVDRDKIILELKMNLEEVEKKYRKLMEKKIILTKELQEITSRIRHPGQNINDHKDSVRNVPIKLFKKEFY